jgi:hypothetical protein
LRDHCCSPPGSQVSGVGCRARLPQVGLRVFTIALLVFGQPFTFANLGVEIAARHGCGLWRKVISASDCLTDLLDGGRWSQTQRTLLSKAWVWRTWLSVFCRGCRRRPADAISHDRGTD